jgi:PhnB protein
MHVSLPVGNGNTLMGCDIPDSRGYPVTVGNNCQISINADSKEEADRFFNALSAGGNVVMPLADAFWGAYFGMFVDKFGINWMVNHDHATKK